jgi:hypothetical protein
MSYIVPAVCDVFAVAIRKMRSILRKQKTVAEKNTTKADFSPTTGVFRSPSRRLGGAALTVCYTKWLRTPLFLFYSIFKFYSF